MLSNAQPFSGIGAHIGTHYAAGLSHASSWWVPTLCKRRERIHAGQRLLDTTSRADPRGGRCGLSGFGIGFVRQGAVIHVCR